MFSFVVTLVASPALWRLSALGSQSDIPIHFDLASVYIGQGQWFTYSIYYPAIYILTLGGIGDFAQISSFLLLAALTAIKAGTALYFARKWLGTERLAQVTALVYVFAMPIVNPFSPDDVYLGQFSANVWHNSTTIMASIFVLPAFWFGLRILDRGDRRSLLLFMFFLLGLVASKPSFALALGPALGAVAFWNLVRNRNIIGARPLLVLIVAATPALVLLVIEYLIVFRNETVLPEVSVSLSPFEVWNLYSSNIPLSALLSLAGPIGVIWAMGMRSFFKDRFMSIATLTLFIAISQYVFVAEVSPTGEVLYAGNWTWAVIPAIALVFYRGTALVLANLSSNEVNASEKLPWLIAGGLIFIHTLTGLYYVFSVGVDDFQTFVK